MSGDPDNKEQSDYDAGMDRGFINGIMTAVNRVESRASELFLAQRDADARSLRELAMSIRKEIGE